jgi:hypothetical protein
LELCDACHIRTELKNAIEASTILQVQPAPEWFSKPDVQCTKCQQVLATPDFVRCVKTACDVHTQCHLFCNSCFDKSPFARDSGRITCAPLLERRVKGTIHIYSDEMVEALIPAYPFRLRIEELDDAYVVRSHNKLLEIR